MRMQRLLSALLSAALLLMTLSGCNGVKEGSAGKMIAEPREGSYPFYAAWITKRGLLTANDSSWRVGMLVGNSVKIISGKSGNPGVSYAGDLPEQFAFTVSVSFSGVKETATLQIDFGEDDSNPYLTLTLTRDPAGKVVASLSNGQKLLCSSGWCKTKSQDFKLILDNAFGDGRIQLHVTGNEDVSCHMETDQTDKNLLASLKRFSFSSDIADLSLYDIGVDIAPYQVGNMKEYAYVAMNDMLRNFWWGDLDSGMLRGGFGGSALFLMSLYNYYLMSQDAISRRIFERQEYMLLNHLDPDEVTVAGTSTTPAGDDAGYYCLYYMYLYRITQNPKMLEYTKALFHSIYDQYWDDIYGGGLWYNQGGAAGGGTGASTWMPRFKSIYSVSTVMAGFEYYDLTGDEEVYRLSVDEYEWMASHLNEGRNDGIYFAEYSDLGAGNGGSADQISSAGSSTMLNGNMGMAVASYKMYKYTNDQKYLDRTLAILGGILNREVVNGLFLCDRDPTTGASFMGALVEMLIEMDKKGIDNGYLERYKAVFYATATLIFTNNRTEEGYYNGAWYYLKEGEKSYSDIAGNTADIIMVSSNSSHVLTAAALLEDYITKKQSN